MNKNDTFIFSENKTVARPKLKKINCHGEFQKIIIAILLFAWVTKVMKF